MRWPSTILAMTLGASAWLPATGTFAQVLEAAVDGSPAGLDPHIITAFNSFQIVNGTIYEGLTQIDKDLRTVPALAESWSVSQDGKTYIFKLRPNVTFHDGSRMEAADVVASIDRMLSKEIASPLASRLSAVDKAAAKDASTVEITLKDTSAPFLTQLASIAIVPRSFEHDKDALQRKPDGTGPFRFKEWQPNGYILLEKHAGYWNAGHPMLDGVKFNIVPESATRQVGLSSGQYAMLPNIDASTALQLKGKPGIKLLQTLDLAYSLIGMNASKPPFDNPKVREALNYALDRSEIVQAALFGAGEPGGPLSPALKDWALNVGSFPCYAHSTEKAQTLLKEAGVATPVALTMLVLPRQDMRDVAQVAQQQLEKAGFEVELKIPELGQFIQDWRNSNFDLFVSLNAGSTDPDDYFYRTFRSGGSTNVFKYSNAELDTLLDDGRKELDPKARKADYDKVQTILACQGPVAHLAYGQLFTATRASLTGFDIIATHSLATLGNASLGK